MFLVCSKRYIFILYEQIICLFRVIIIFIFIGDEDRTYFVDLTADGLAGKGKPTTKPDATLTMEADKLEELFNGESYYLNFELNWI